MPKTYKFDITPATAIRTTQGDRIFFRIPRDKLYPSGLKRLLRIEKYNKYKVDLLALAKKHRFSIPDQGMHLTFYIPCPKSWKPWQKEVMHMKLHQKKCDLDNYTKAFFDSLSNEDKTIGHLGSLTKLWVNSEKGWIEITVDEPKIPILQLPTSQKKYLAAWKEA